MEYQYLGSIFRGPLTGVTIGYYPRVPLDVDPEDTVPIVLRRVLHGLENEYGRVVDQDLG